jgi:hypothetical protein
MVRNKTVLQMTLDEFLRTESMAHVGNVVGIPRNGLDKIVHRFSQFSLNDVHMLVDKSWFCANPELLPLSPADLF